MCLVDADKLKIYKSRTKKIDRYKISTISLYSNYYSILYTLYAQMLVLKSFEYIFSFKGTRHEKAAKFDLS